MSLPYRAYNELCSRVLTVVVSVVVAVQPVMKIAARPRRVSAIRCVFMWGNQSASFGGSATPFAEVATNSGVPRELTVMKPRYSVLCFLVVGSLIFSGCATDTTTTTQTQVDQTRKRVHTQDELKKSGETNAAAALEKTDPAVRVSGPR